VDVCALGHFLYELFCEALRLEARGGFVARIMSVNWPNK
jgi:hypothetical protein